MSQPYTMRELDVTLPLVTNNGTVSYYADWFRAAVERYGIAGWTEVQGEGMWHGQREPVTVFTFYVPTAVWRLTLRKLGEMAREAAPDQEAIQVVDHGEVTLSEF